MESPAPTGARSREGIEDLVTHLIPTKPYDRYIDDTVFLDVKEHLNQHPDKLVQRWNEHPRLYTLLRMLGYEDDGQVFKAFDREQIGDVWLPLSDQTLNYFSSIGLSASEFYRTQLHILSKSERMSEQQLLSEVHAHRYILSGRSHFDDIEILGTGGSAEVARVRHKLSGKQFACKRIWRGKSIKEQRDQLVEFEQEVGVLQRISHKHLVSFVASYTDFETFSLILNPVAKDVLKSVIMRQSRERPLPAEDVWTLRRAFGCLATALAYLHEQRVRHKDIKPGNILLTDGRVYLCDFGISRDWSKSEHSTTEGDVLKFTRRYCAPEVFGRDPRNSASDIWSLGCVFLELITVIKGYPIDEMNQFMLRHSADASAQGLWCAQEAMNAWLVKIRSENNNSADDVPLDWITPMIRTDPEDRPKASDVVDMIHKQSAEMPHPDLYIAPCCHRSDSITPIEGVESPTLHEPTFSNVLGIRNVPSSPPRPYLDVVPNRNQSPVIAGRRSPRVADRRRGSRDRSISPTTQSYPKQLDSTDTIPFPMDPIQSPVSGPLRPISTISHNSSRTSQSQPVSQARQSFASSGFQRSPVPPPASFEVKCSCAARVNEEHIFNAPFVSLATIPSAPTVETCNKCEVGENRIQIYETLPEDPNIGHGGPAFEDTLAPKIWWVTRRLVISYLSGTPEMRLCSSFWLPLADMVFTISGTEVTIHWSDCNQMTAKGSGNYGQHYDWLYDPSRPNHSLTIRFHDFRDAQRFIDCVRFPHEDGITVRNGQNVEVSESEEVQIYDIGRKATIGKILDYRIAVVTRRENAVSYSKLIIRWPELDLDIQILERFAKVRDYLMQVKLDNVVTPTYHSSVRGEPAVDYNKVARFKTAHQLKSSLMVTFPIGRGQGLPVPPSGVVAMLNGLTGWTLRYFAIINKFRSKNKRLGSKKYGRADIMLWEKEVEDASARRRGTQITFRQHEESDKIWTSGTIDNTTTITYSSSSDTTITVTNKTRGNLLDTINMSAVSAEPNAKEHRHSRNQSDAHDDHSELVLTFEDASYRLKFVNLVEDFKASAATTATLMRRSTSNGQSEPVRRINSLASDNIHMSPPLRGIGTKLSPQRSPLIQ